MNPPLLLTGAARSGTSMTAGIVYHCGSFGGKTSGPTAWNRKGMFENAEIRESVMKPYLQLHGADPKGQKPLPDPHALLPISNFRAKIESIMKFSGYQNGHWFYKGAKMCLVWPLWDEAFSDAKWIIIRRKDEEIVHSCMKTAFMNGYNHPDGWQFWVDEHKKRFSEMHEHGLMIREVWPSQFVAGDFSEIKDVIEWAGLKWNEEAVKGFIDPSLWRSKNG